MASIAELKRQLKLAEQIKDNSKEIKKIEEQISAQTNKNAAAAKARAEKEKEILSFKKSILKEEKASNSLAKDLNKLLGTQKGKLLESLGVLDKSNAKALQKLKTEALNELRTTKMGKVERQNVLNTVKGLNAVRDLQSDVLSEFEAGTLENMGKRELFQKVLEKAELSEKEFNKMSAKGKRDIYKQVIKLKKGIQTLTQDDMQEMVDAVGDIEDEFGGLIKKAGIYGGILKSKELRGTALKAGIAAAAFSFAKGLVENAKELKQELGLSVGEAAALGAKVSVVETTFTKLGMRAGEVKAFSVAISQEFGNIDELSLSTLNKFAEISRDTGISGENAAKLAKSIQIIQGGTLESSLNTIEVAANLADAAGVSKKLVLEDIAQDAENFAKFAKDGGRNIATAAVSARRLGLSLGTVASIAENLLDFESSIESQMEASVLLGRQLNLDKARELALTGDLAGLAEEVKNQVGSQADFEAMNVIERQSLAKAIGVSVADLGKIVAGDKTSAELAEDKALALEEQQKTQFELTKTMAQMQTITATAAVLQGVISTGKALHLMLAKKETTEKIKSNSVGIIGQTIDTAKSALGAIRLTTENAITAAKTSSLALGAKELATTAASAAATLAKGVGGIFSTFAKIPFGLGIPLALAAVGSMYAMSKRAKSGVPKLETGGVVKESGIAEIHKGEVFSGTKNEMGFGSDMKETNNLLQKVIDESRQLRTENKQLMNTLTGKVGEMAMSS